MDDAADLFVALVVFVVAVAFAWALDTFLAYVAIEAVGGYDLELRQAAGVGLLLLTMQSTYSAKRS